MDQFACLFAGQKSHNMQKFAWDQLTPEQLQNNEAGVLLFKV